MAQRLPKVASDDNAWGGILNGFLQTGHNWKGGLYTINNLPNGTYPTSYNIGSVESGSLGYDPTGPPPAGTPLANEYFLINCSSTSFTLTLPDATNANFSNMIYNVKVTGLTGAYTLTINTVNSQTIDGGSTALIKVPYVSIQIVTDGSNWFVI